MSSLHPTAASLGLSVVIIWLFRRDHLHVIHGLFWLVVAALAALLGVWTGLIDRFASWVSISYPPALLFLAAAIVLLVKAPHANIHGTRVEREVMRLNRHMAMLGLGQAERLSALGKR